MKLYCKSCKSKKVKYKLRVEENGVFVCLELSCNNCFEIEILRILKPSKFSVDMEIKK